MLAILRGFLLSPSFPGVEFHAVRRHCKMNQEGQRGHLLGFEEKLCAIEEAEVQKATDMVKIYI